MFRLSTIILAVLVPLSYCQEDNAEFLLENAKLCGNPFSDPIWIPVLDTCTEKCDPATEYCVENEDLVQQCKPLPDECQKLWAQRRKALASKSNFAAGVKSVVTGNSEPISDELQDKVVEKSVGKRVKSPMAREGTAGVETKQRSSDSTRHRVKRI